MMDEQSISEFLKKFSHNQHTEQEHQQFIEWLNTAALSEVQEILEEYQYVFEMRASEESTEHLQLVKKIEVALNELDSPEVKTAAKPLRLWPRLKTAMSIAALLFVIATAGIYLSINKNVGKAVSPKDENAAVKSRLPHNNNKAILILADGSKIVLDNTQNGVVATQAGINISKTANGQIIVDALQAATQSSESKFNTITTPRSGQYQVVLPDGSRVWLNAASSLKFPTSFSDRERKVELTGEAYFEVAKVMSASKDGREGTRVPFKVISGNQTVEVLGTHFNINAYPDEATINTTLLEGSVKVSQLLTHHSELLKPGQQAKVDELIRVSNIDATQAIDWKNGYFVFSHENIQSIMRKISRWYDVDIKYEGNITAEGFTGSMSRFEDVSQVLNMLQLTGSVHFKIDNGPVDSGQAERRIVVMP